MTLGDTAESLDTNDTERGYKSLATLGGAAKNRRFERSPPVAGAAPKAAQAQQSIVRHFLLQM